MAQTQIAAREAEQQRIVAAAAAAPGLEVGVELPPMEEEEEEKENSEATDEKVAAAQKQTSRRGASARADLGGDDILDAAVLDVEAPAVEEGEVNEGYVLEDEDEELEKEEEEDEGLGPLGGGDEDLGSTRTSKREGPRVCACLSYAIISCRMFFFSHGIIKGELQRYFGRIAS